MYYLSIYILRLYVEAEERSSVLSNYLPYAYISTLTFFLPMKPDLEYTCLFLSNCKLSMKC